MLEGQDIRVTAAFDSARILIGDQIHFSLTVEQPSDVKLNLPVFKDTLTKNIEILSGPKIDTSKVAGQRLRIIEQYLITSFDSGLYEIKPVYVEKNDINGLKRYYSGYSVLEVARAKIAPPDTASKIFDIKGPYKAPLTPGEVLPWVLLALLAGGIAWLVIRLIKRLKKPGEEIKAPVITEPAHVIAFRELENLRDEQLWQKGEIKKYHTRLTGILRQYLENRFGVFSLELTTSETLDALVRTGFKKDRSYNLLKSVLNSADLVKFAKYVPEPVENDVVFQSAWDFVDSTKLLEVIQEAPAAAVPGKEEIR